MPQTKIRDIVQKGVGFKRFRVHDCRDGRFVLISEQRELFDKYGAVVRIEVASQRLEQLANDILSHLKKEAKLQEWNPSDEEFEAALERKYGKGNGMNFFVIDWVRTAVNFDNEEGIK